MTHDLPPIGARMTIRGVDGTIASHAEAGIGWMALWIPDNPHLDGQWMTESECRIVEDTDD